MKSRVLFGAYSASFFTSSDDPPIYHSIITKQGSREIIAWIQCRLEEDCERQAAEALRQLVGSKNANLLVFPQTSRLHRLKKKKLRTKKAQASSG